MQRVEIGDAHGWRILSGPRRDTMLHVTSVLWAGDASARPLRAFPGANPSSLMVEDLEVLRRRADDYVAAEKTDGVRYWFVASTIDGSRMAWLVNRKLEIVQVSVMLAEGAYRGTLLDAELVPRLDGDTHDFLVFDCVAANGEYVGAQTYWERLRAAETVLPPATSLPPPHVAAFARLSIKTPRPVRELSEVIREIRENLGRAGEYPTDGLLLTPVSERAKSGMQRTLFKWKPPDRHTIDLLAVATPGLEEEQCDLFAVDAAEDPDNVTGTSGGARSRSASVFVCVGSIATPDVLALGVPPAAVGCCAIGGIGTRSDAWAGAIIECSVLGKPDPRLCDDPTIADDAEDEKEKGENASGADGARNKKKRPRAAAARSSTSFRSDVPAPTWRAVMWRKDKALPNGVLTVRRTLRNIIEDIKHEDLLAACEAQRGDTALAVLLAQEEEEEEGERQRVQNVQPVDETHDDDVGQRRPTDAEAATSSGEREEGQKRCALCAEADCSFAKPSALLCRRCSKTHRACARCHLPRLKDSPDQWHSALICVMCGGDSNSSAPGAAAPSLKPTTTKKRAAGLLGPSASQQTAKKKKAVKPQPAKE